MIPVQKVLDELDKQRKRLAKLEGEQLAGFVLIVDPTGVVVDWIPLGDMTEERFAIGLKGEITSRLRQGSATEPDLRGGVTMPRGVR